MIVMSRAITAVYHHKNADKNWHRFRNTHRCYNNCHDELTVNLYYFSEAIFSFVIVRFNSFITFYTIRRIITIIVSII